MPKRTKSGQKTGNSAVTSFMRKNEKPHASAHETMSSLLNQSASSKRREGAPSPRRRAGPSSSSWATVTPTAYARSKSA